MVAQRVKMHRAFGVSTIPCTQLFFWGTRMILPSGWVVSSFSLFCSFCIFLLEPRNDLNCTLVQSYQFQEAGFVVNRHRTSVELCTATTGLMTSWILTAVSSNLANICAASGNSRSSFGRTDKPEPTADSLHAGVDGVPLPDSCLLVLGQGLMQILAQNSLETKNVIDHSESAASRSFTG